MTRSLYCVVALSISGSDSCSYALVVARKHRLLKSLGLVFTRVHVPCLHALDLFQQLLLVKGGWRSKKYSRYRTVLPVRPVVHKCNFSCSVRRIK